ncbi:hypothetical protein M9Y10_035522 [Tritrichomonas musculus]|uniref:Protein kinase domain-containing protein n=1 Tax=Tritrichomonas musculus TaxID=1915356 RepID=A0ABR2KHZ9_9EUKA
MKKSNFTVIQESIRKLPNDVNLGICMDPSINVTYSFLSFPKNRFSEDLVEERIQKLSKYKTMVLNAVIGYFVQDELCYLIQEQQNVFTFISDFWSNIAENLDSDGMDMNRDVSMQFIYALAYILKFFDEINLGAAKSGFDLASYHDQFEPCFTGLGFPEIFEEHKTSENNAQYFEDFCKKMNPKMENISSYNDIINNNIIIPGSSEKREEIIELCKIEEDYQNSEDSDDDNDDYISQYKKENMQILQECIKQLPNNVKLGKCMDTTTNCLYSFLSFPKKRFPAKLIDERISKLSGYQTKVLNAVIGFFVEGKRCYLIQEQNVEFFISTFWSNVKNTINLEVQGMEMYKDLAMQLIYALAYILKYFDEIGLGAAKNAYTLAAYYGQFEPCFIALGFPEIFEEIKSSEDNQQYFEDFCKEINLKLDKITNYYDLINGTTKIKGSKEKYAEIIFQCTGEKPEIDEDDSEELSSCNYENNNISVLSECVKELPNDVKLGCGNDLKNNKVFSFISCPEDRISKEKIIERIDLLNKYHTKLLNAVVGFFYQNGRCYLIQEQDVINYLPDNYHNFATSLYKKGGKGFRIIAMMFIYALAYILKNFDEINIGAAQNAYELAFYMDEYEPRFVGLGFPEIFGEDKTAESNPQYFHDFCKKMNPNMKKIPTYNDLINGNAKILGSREKLAEILFLCTGKHVEIPEPTYKDHEEEEDFEYNDEDQQCNIENRKYKVIDLKESILTEQVFNEPFYQNIDSHIYDLPPLFQTNEYINNGSIDFLCDGTIIHSLGSEFEIGNIAQQECISHKCPNDPISFANEKMIITNMNCLYIPYCMHHSENNFIYLVNGKYEPISQADFDNYIIVNFISFLYDLHQKGFLYLRNDINNIFICDSKTILFCGFDTCTKIGSKECTSEMFDWDDEPNEFTDYICLGTFIYYILTKKQLFDQDSSTNKEMFKNKIRISAKELGLTKAKLLRRLLNPDPNVRKSVDIFEILDCLNLNNYNHFFPNLFTFYSNKNEYNLLMQNYLFDSNYFQILDRSSSPPIWGVVDKEKISLSTSIGRLFSINTSIDHEQFIYQISGKNEGHISLNNGVVWMTLFLPCGQTHLKWDNESGIIIKFPNFSVKMLQDGSLIYQDGNFKKKMEDGKLIIEGEGLSMIHSGKTFELLTKAFTFTMIDDECWEIKGPVFYAKYTPSEIFIKAFDHWIKYSYSHVEIGFRGMLIVFTDEIFQVKYSFLEISKNKKRLVRYRFFDKEIIPDDLENDSYQMNFFEIPYIEMPKIPMKAKNKVEDKITAEERAIDVDDSEIIICREDFIAYYDDLKNNISKKYYDPDELDENEVQIKEPIKKKSKKKKDKNKEIPKQNKNTNENQAESMEIPLIENATSQNLISQEDLPQDFDTAQAIGKIKKLLEGGENIAYLTSARIINFLKPKRVRKIVITSAGRIFLTNIGGDGILANIEIDKKSRTEVNGNHIKVYGSKKSFHFVFDDQNDCSTFAEKFNQCLDK